MAEAVDSGTYTSDTLKRKIALSLLGESMKQQPVRHWAEGLAQMGRSALGGYLAYQAGEEEKANSAAQSEALKSFLGGGGAESTGSRPPNVDTATPSPDNGPSPSAVKTPAVMTPQARIDQAFDALRSVENPGLPSVTSKAEPMGSLPGMSRGLRNNNPLNIEAGDFTKGQTGYTGSDGRFAKFSSLDQGIRAADNLLTVYSKKHGLNTVSGIVNRWAPPSDGNPTSAYADTVAKAIGVAPDQPIDMGDSSVRRRVIEAMSKFENGRPLTTAQPAVLRGQPPSAQAIPNATPGERPVIPANDARSRVIQMLNDKNPAVQKIGRSLASNLVAKQFEGEKPTDDIKEYERAQKDPAFRQYMIDMKKAGSQSISIDQRGEAEFDKKAAGHQAERFDKLVQGGMDAKAMTADLNALKDIGSRITTGKTAELTAALGPYAEAAGVKIEGLDDLQAYKSIVAKLAPRMRVAGSGATSDFEMRQFLEALPGLGKTPGGNEMISTTLEALQAHKEQAAEIASRAMNKELTPREADKLLRSLPDPLTAWKQSKGTTTLKPTSTAPAGTTKTGVPWKVVD